MAACRRISCATTMISIACWRTLAFIGSPDYIAHKDTRFPAADDKNIGENPAFHLTDPEIRELFQRAYESTRAL